MLRSFVLSSTSSRTLRKLVMLFLGAVIALVITDIALGFLLPYITIEPPSILLLQNVQGVEKLWHYANVGIEPVVFTGSSQASRGLSPYEFNEEIKATTGHSIESVSISLWASVASIQHDLIKNLIIPNHPKVIIYGIEARALNGTDLYDVRVSDFHNTPLGYAVSTESDIERNLLLWLLQHSNLMRYRDNFQQWFTGTRERNQLDYDPSQADDLGHFVDPAIHDRNPASILGLDNFVAFTPFKVEARPQQTLNDIAKVCKQSGVLCILLNMPLHEMAYQYITEADETLYQDELHETGLPIWDFNTRSCRTLLGDASFFDLNHLNEHGAQILSRIVADAYAHAFYNLPISKDASCAKINS